MKNPHADRRNDPDPLLLDEDEAEAAPGATPEQIAVIIKLAREQYRLNRWKGYLKRLNKG
jgi:hypothetical protein